MMKYDYNVNYELSKDSEAMFDNIAVIVGPSYQ
jgi:hypothetical protein